MTRVGFQKSVRMFHKFSEETLRRRGGNQSGRESVVALAAIEAVLKAERAFDAGLLEPLSAFTNLLQSSQLPPEFGDYSFGDALLAIEEAHAELRQHAEQRWEFEPNLDEQLAAKLAQGQAPAAEPSNGVHANQLRRFVLDAAQKAQSGSALVVGALAAPELPLAELASRFERLTLNDLDLPRLEELVRRVIPEPHRARVKLERYDATGSYAELERGIERIVTAASNADEAEAALVDWLQSYDVGAGSAGLSALEEKPNLAISAMLLDRLGEGFGSRVAAAFASRGWDVSAVDRAPLLPALSLLRCFVAQHHIHALLRRAQSAALVSAVSTVELLNLPGGKSAADGEPVDLLWVERLVERLPEMAQVKAEQSWEWRREHPTDGQKRSLLTLVEAVLV